MEKHIQMSGRKGVAGLSKSLLLVFLFSLLNLSSLFAQSDPSSQNLNRNAHEISSEMQRIKEKERHDEILSYVYMSVGFAIVIAIAWITTVMGRKRTRKDAEEKQRYILRQQELKKHGHHSPGHGHGHHGHSHLNKARR